jgi:hypothetical protein
MARKLKTANSVIAIVTGYLTLVVFLYLTVSLVHAQLKVENPQHLEFEEDRAQVLHRIICRVVADELHLRESKTELPVTLVLGEPEERIRVDEDGIPRKLYLKRWDEASFAISDMQLVMQRAVIHDHWQRMMNEVIRRWKQVAPVPARNRSSLR